MSGGYIGGGLGNGGGKPQRIGRLLTFLTNAFYILLGGSGIFAVSQSQWHDPFLSALSAGTVVLFFIAYKWVTRAQRRRRRAFEEGEVDGEQLAPLGRVGRFFQTRPGRAIILTLGIVLIIGLLSLMAYEMKHCPRAPEGLC